MKKLQLGLFRRKYSLLIIPEHSGTSRRLHLSALPLLLAGAVFGLLIASALTLLYLRAGDAARIEALRAELEDAVKTYEESIADRELSIALLQSEVKRLTEEAGAVRLKLDELDRLGEEIEAIVEIALPDETRSSPAAFADIPGSVEVEALSYSGIGGEDHPLDEDEASAAALPGIRASSLTAMKYEADSLHHRLQAKKEEARRVLDRLKMLPTAWPTASRRITSEFGVRSDPFTRRPAKHSGIDLGGKTGDPVYASGGGKVVDSAYNRSRGHYVIIEHDSGYQSVYMHLRKRLVSAGQTVEQGEQIGTLGSTGRSTGPHLHFEIWKDGQAVDPLPYLQLFKEENS